MSQFWYNISFYSQMGPHPLSSAREPAEWLALCYHRRLRVVECAALHLCCAVQYTYMVEFRGTGRPSGGASQRKNAVRFVELADELITDGSINTYFLSNTHK